MKKTSSTAKRVRKPIPFPTLEEISRPAHSKVPQDGGQYMTEDLIVESVKKKRPPMTFQQKVHENSRTTWYAFIMVSGISLLIAIGINFYRDMFAKNSVNFIYGDTANIVKRNTEVQDAIGTPIVVHGEETRRGWRRHISSTQFYNEGKLYLRIRFYLHGPYRNATVDVEKVADEKGVFDKYTYILVELHGYPHRIIDINVENL